RRPRPPGQTPRGYCAPSAVPAPHPCRASATLAAPPAGGPRSSCRCRAGRSERPGDPETRRQGDKENTRWSRMAVGVPADRRSSPCLLVSGSPCLRVSGSPCLLVFFVKVLVAHGDRRKGAFDDLVHHLERGLLAGEQAKLGRGL